MNPSSMLRALLLVAVTEVYSGCGVAEEFRVAVRAEEIPEAGSVTYTVLTGTVNEYMFLPPPGWKREIDTKAGAVTLTSPDFRSSMTVRVPGSRSEDIAKLNPDELRQKVLLGAPDAKIVEESPSYTAGLAGLALDTERITENKLRVRCRDAWFAVPGGLVHIRLATPEAEFPVRQSDFSRFLNSFRATRRTAS